MKLSRLGIEYTLATALTALVVFWIATLSVDAAGQVGAAWGSGVAFALQSAAFWSLFLWLLRDNWVLANGLGMLFRFVGFAVVGFVVIPAFDLPAAPTLFAFVSCLFVSILLEAVFLKRLNAAAKVAETAQLRTQH